MKHIYFLARKSAWLLMVAMPLHAHAAMGDADVIDAEKSVAITINMLKSKDSEVLKVLSKVNSVKASGTDGQIAAVTVNLITPVLLNGLPVDEIRYEQEEGSHVTTVTFYREGVLMSPSAPSLYDPFVSFYNFFKSMAVPTKAY
jgi:hypothetical protein